MKAIGLLVLLTNLFNVALGEDQNAATPSLSVQMQIAALERNDVAEVQRVLDAGFDPNENICVGPPLFAAIYKGNVEMAKLLLSRGAKVSDDAMDRVCVRQGDNWDITMVKLLVAHGGNVNASNGKLTSCLHHAVWAGNVPLVQFLASCKGIDLNMVRNDGDELDTPLDGTPLMWALQRGTTGFRIATILLDAGADPNVRNEKGQTAAELLRINIATSEGLLRRMSAETKTPSSGAR